MKIYICDDEHKILHKIVQTVQSYLPKEHITGFFSGRELSAKLKEEGCDILFLDIDLPDINGMEIAKELNRLDHRPLLVFITNHDELVYESLQYHPFGFIRKQCFAEEIGKVLEDCKEELSSLERNFHFRMESRDVVLPLSDIFYFEADGNYLKLNTGVGMYRFRSTLSAVENSLADQGFVRVHKGFLVNQQAVRTIGREELELVNREIIPFGKSYAEMARTVLLKYMRI